MSEADYPVCELFTVLESRADPHISRCDVCDQGERAHAKPGRRTLKGGEIEALRRQMLIAIHEKREAENPSQYGHNGTAHVNNVTRPESSE
jgi:hypothetical protein